MLDVNDEFLSPQWMHNEQYTDAKSLAWKTESVLWFYIKTQFVSRRPQNQSMLLQSNTEYEGWYRNCLPIKAQISSFPCRMMGCSVISHWRLLASTALQSSAQDSSRRCEGFAGRCLLWQAVKRTCSQEGLGSTPSTGKHMCCSRRAQHYVWYWPGPAALTHPGYQVCRLWGCLRSLWSCLWSGWSAPGTRGPDVSLPMHTVDKHTSVEETMETGRKWAEIQTLMMQWCSCISRVCWKQDINIIYVY